MLTSTTAIVELAPFLKINPFVQDPPATHETYEKSHTSRPKTTITREFEGMPVRRFRNSSSLLYFRAELEPSTGAGSPKDLPFWPGMHENMVHRGLT